MSKYKWIRNLLVVCCLILAGIAVTDNAYAYTTYYHLRQTEGCGYSWTWNGNSYSCTGPCYWSYINYGYEKHCKMISHYNASFDQAAENKEYWDQVVQNWEACTKEPVPGTGYAATCTTYGKKDVLKCIYCYEVFSGKQEIIPPLGHQVVTIEGSAATCTETGLTEGSVCSVCNDVVKKQTIIPAFGHSEETIKGTVACTDCDSCEGPH